MRMPDAATDSDPGIRGASSLFARLVEYILSSWVVFHSIGWVRIRKSERCGPWNAVTRARTRQQRRPTTTREQFTGRWLLAAGGWVVGWCDRRGREVFLQARADRGRRAKDGLAQVYAARQQTQRS